MTAVASPALRWSSVRDCARKAVYEATDAPARERTLREDRQLYRGRSVGHDWIISVATEKMWKVWIDSGPTHWLPPDLLAADEDSADVIAELRVQWELGIGHADLYIRETDTVIEVLSSQNPTGNMIRSKLIQARGYARTIDASNIALIIVDPSTLDEERVIVTSKSAQWEDLGAECDDRIAQALAWRDTGNLPGRVCAHPGEAWGHFCVFAAHCFDGYQAPALEAIDTEDARTLAARLAHVKAKRREIGVTDKLLETEQKDIQSELLEHVPAGEWQVGAYRVKHSERAGRRSFDFDRAENDSRIGELLVEFVKTGKPYQVWDVEQTGPATVSEDDYGDVPWTAEDLDG